VNNLYPFQGDRTVLGDTGSSTPAVRDQLERGLDDCGSSVAGVDAVVLTHYHIDHCGQVAEIQCPSGATVYTHDDDLALVTGDDGAWRPSSTDASRCTTSGVSPRINRTNLKRRR
jgi:glyoxylase-like metal-dependent hydrolase (beta-lactamase superfamily II)